MSLNATTITAGTTLDNTHNVVLCNNTSGAALTIALPAAASNTDKVYYIKKTDSSAFACVIDPNGAETVEDMTTYTLHAQYDAVRIVCDGSEWFIIGDRGATTLTASQTDDTFSGTKITATAGENLTIGNIVYMKSDGKLWKADADAIATSGAIAIALASISADAAGMFGTIGLMRDDSAYAWTVGGLLYLSTTAGDITQTAPSGADDVIQVLGVALSADVIYFKPELTQVEHV